MTIIPRGQALGVTFMLGEEDVYTHSKLELFDRMTVMMGGRAAEELIFRRQLLPERRMILKWRVTGRG